jgi:hypothetical protein
MAFNTKLDIDQLSDVRVIDFSYSLSRDIDPTGRPSGLVRGGTINITVETTSKHELFDWMITNKTVDGSLKIEDDLNPGADLKVIKFEKAFIIDYSESFHWQGTENMMQSFTISAKKIDIDGSVHENLWTT